MATAAVRDYGMFGEELGFSTIGKKQASEEYNAAVDRVVKKVLDVSESKWGLTDCRIHLKGFVV